MPTKSLRMLSFLHFCYEYHASDPLDENRPTGVLISEVSFHRVWIALESGLTGLAGMIQHGSNDFPDIFGRSRENSIERI